MGQKHFEEGHDMSNKDNIVNLLGTPSFGVYDDKIQDVTIDELEKIYNNMFKDNINYKYAEDKILKDLRQYLDKTYSQHYKTEQASIECFDAWIALGDATPTFRNTALKYLWRYGKKNGNNKDDLMKVLHYTFMMLYNDFYKEKN